MQQTGTAQGIRQRNYTPMKNFLILNSAPARQCIRTFLLAGGFLILNFFSSAQVIIIGGKGIVNGCRLANKTVDDAGDELKYDFTWDFAGGAYLRYYFNEATYYSKTNISLCVEALYNSYGQKYRGDILVADTPVYSFTSRTRISSFDIPVMIHIKGQAGLYGEFGVSFGMINGVTQDYSQDPEDVDSLNFSERSTDNLFTTSNLSAVFGFGIDSELNERLNFTAGMRLTYGITDLTEPQKQAYPGTYNETHSATIGIVIGLAYILNFYHDYH